MDNALTTNDGPQNETGVAINKIMKQCIARIGEQDPTASIRIFVTAHDSKSGDTNSYSTGYGDFYAQIGYVSEWVVRQNEIVRSSARRDAE